MNHNHSLAMLATAPSSLDTARRLAATIAVWSDIHTASCTWPSSMLSLRRVYALPLSDEEIEAGMRQLLQAEGETIRACTDYGRHLIFPHPGHRVVPAQQFDLLTCHLVWQVDPTPLAVPIPPCARCGQQKDLSMPCGGITYGTIGVSGLFMTCPFEEYGCANEMLRWTCCRCRILWQRIQRGASVAEIEDSIAALRCAPLASNA